MTFQPDKPRGKNWQLVTVYGLASSEDGRIRYIGQTRSSLRVRLRNHHAVARRFPHRHLSRWILSIRSHGATVKIFRIEAGAVRDETERRLIAWYWAHGARLVNATDGGDSARRAPKSLEERAKISAAMRGRKFTQEHRKKISEAQCRRPRWLIEEIGRKVSRTTKGRAPSNLLANQAALRGNPKSAHHKMKLSSALRAYFAQKRVAQGGGANGVPAR